MRPCAWLPRPGSRPKPSPPASLHGACLRYSDKTPQSEVIGAINSEDSLCLPRSPAELRCSTTEDTHTGVCHLFDADGGAGHALLRLPTFIQSKPIFAWIEAGSSESGISWQFGSSGWIDSQEVTMVTRCPAGRTTSKRWRCFRDDRQWKHSRTAVSLPPSGTGRAESAGEAAAPQRRGAVLAKKGGGAHKRERQCLTAVVKIAAMESVLVALREDEPA